MKEQFVTYEIALKLKELGFDKPCFNDYNSEGEFKWMPFEYDRNLKIYRYSLLTNSDNNSTNFISAPLWQQTLDWFREKHNIMITIYSNASGYLCETHDAIGGTQRWWSEYSGPNGGGCWDKYEDVREHVILKTIELCQKK